MKKRINVVSVPGLFASLAMALYWQPVAADLFITSDYTFGGGDYFIEDNRQNSISDFGGGGAFGGGVEFDGSLFPVANSSSGSGGGDAFIDIYVDDHNFIGNGGAGSQVLDPLNELSFIQIDGESIVDFGFSIATPHTYTLTGNLSANELGRVSLVFDAVTLTQADGDYSLTGTLAAGDYSLLIDSIGALDSPGSAFSNYDFNLQLVEVSAVPLPAAFWLFASGLMGLFGVVGTSRKKGSAA